MGYDVDFLAVPSLRELTLPLKDDAAKKVLKKPEPFKDASQIQAALLKLEAVTGPQYGLGMKTFYVLTRYSRSVNYAMSVRALAQEIRAAYQSVRASGSGG